MGTTLGKLNYTSAGMPITAPLLSGFAALFYVLFHQTLGLAQLRSLSSCFIVRGKPLATLPDMPGARSLAVRSSLIMGDLE